MRTYIVFSYDSEARLSAKQRKVGEFDDRGVAERAAWDALISDDKLDSVQVLRRSEQVYFVDRRALAEGAQPPGGAPTIRVIQRGDHDDQMVIHVVGPFVTATARDEALRRLQDLPLVREFAWLSASLIPPAAADHAITAAVAARVRDGNELFEEMFNR